MDQLVSGAPGIAIIGSCGNYFQRRTHAAWRLRPGQARRFHLDVDPRDRTTNQVDLWYPGRDRLLVELTAADGPTVSIPLGEHAAVVIDGREAARVYHRACDPNNGDHQVSAAEEQLIQLHREAMGSDPPVQHGGRGIEVYLRDRHGHDRRNARPPSQP